MLRADKISTWGRPHRLTVIYAHVIAERNEAIISEDGGLILS